LSTAKCTMGDDETDERDGEDKPVDDDDEDEEPETDAVVFAAVRAVSDLGRLVAGATEGVFGVVVEADRADTRERA
ncbi:hypothetical protein HK100_008649, partial [Physocladia obscura]